LAKGNTGFSRKGPNENNDGNTNWEGQLCPDWNSKVHQINGKHQDANGDGIVDTLDYIVVLENMGLENPDHYINSNNISYTDDGFELTLVPVDGSVTEFDLYLRNIEGTVGIYGISSTIQFNKPLSSASIDFTNSCLDTLHSFKDFDLEKGQLEFALTQVDNVNIDCDDALARLIVIVVEEIGADDDGFFTFKVNGISSQSNSNSGGNIFQPLSVSASANISASAEEDLYVNVVKSPQHCNNGDKVNGKATAYVSGGKPPYTYLWDNGETTKSISNLLAGEYTLKVTDKEGIEVNLLVDIENEIVYDNDGNVVECEIETGNDCPTDIDFGTYIQNGTDHIMHHGIYAANNNIYTSAKILKNEEVDLQAGDGVILKPGFTMEPDAELNVNIQNCNEE